MARWMAFDLFVACAIHLALSQSRFESYTEIIFRTTMNCHTRSRTSCTGSWWWKECLMEYFCEYYTDYESVIITKTRCQRGWSPPATCDVLDPCVAGISGCQQRCTYGGTNGSYICSCESQYELADDKHTCKPTDECTKGNNDCRTMENFVCQNTSDGFQCLCKDGFTLKNPNQCVAMDECTALNNDCRMMENFVCRNTSNGFQCLCKDGFTLVSQQQCVVQNSSLFSTDEGDDHLANLNSNIVDRIGIKTVIIGGVSLVIAAAVVVIVVICYRRRRKRNDDNLYDQSITGVARSGDENIYELPVTEGRNKFSLKRIFTKSFSQQQNCSTQPSSDDTKAKSKEPSNDTVMEDLSIYQELTEPLKRQGAEAVYQDLVFVDKAEKKTTKHRRTE